MASHPSEPTLTDTQIGFIAAFSDAASAASMVGSAFILLVYARFPPLRRLSFTLVAALAATDFLNQIFDVISPSAADLRDMASGAQPTSALCYVQAVGDSFFEMASVLWTACIAMLLYSTVMWRWRWEDTWRTLGRFAAVVFSLAAALTIAPAAAGALGSGGTDCWIRPAYWPWRLGIFFVPLWLVIIFNTVCYVRVFILLRRTVRMAGAGDAVAVAISGMMARLSVYPFILAWVWLLPSIAALIEAAGGGQPYGLAFVASVVASLQGLFNACAYGFSPGVREALADLPVCHACCRRCARCCTRLCCTGGSGGAAGDDDNAAGGAQAVQTPKLLAEPSGLGGPATVVTNNQLLLVGGGESERSLPVPTGPTAATSFFPK